MPSPCAVFTSAPSFNSALTASWLPCMAASTTEVAGDAAYSSAEKHSAPIALVEIKHLRIIARLPADHPRATAPVLGPALQVSWGSASRLRFASARRAVAQSAEADAPGLSPSPATPSS